jgi:hypothetical protein
MQIEQMQANLSALVDPGRTCREGGRGQGRGLISCNIQSCWCHALIIPSLAKVLRCRGQQPGGPRKKFSGQLIIVKFSVVSESSVALPCLVTPSHRMAFPAACWDECVSSVFCLRLLELTVSIFAAQ